MAKGIEKTEQEWSVDDDIAVFRRVARVLDQVPRHAKPRMRGYLHSLIEEGLRMPVVLPTRHETGEQPVVQADDDEEWRGTGALR